MRLNKNQIALLGTLTDRELAKRWKCSIHAVAHQRRRLGIPSTQKPWTAAQIQLVEKNFFRKGKEWCAEQLGRSPVAVYNRAHLIGLTRRTGEKRTVPTTERARRIVKAVKDDPSLSLSEAARRFGVSRQAISQLWNKYDIRTDRRHKTSASSK